MRGASSQLNKRTAAGYPFLVIVGVDDGVSEEGRRLRCPGRCGSRRLFPAWNEAQGKAACEAAAKELEHLLRKSPHNALHDPTFFLEPNVTFPTDQSKPLTP